MTILRVALLASSISALTGCSSLISAPTAQWPWPNDKNLCANQTCTPVEAIDAYAKASLFCREVQNYYEAGGTKASGAKFAISTTGAIAGGIMAPVTTGTASTAWSGLSGITNAVQTSLDESFSSIISIGRRKAVSTAASEGTTAFNQATDNNGKVIAAINMARSCAMSPATSDQTALQLLTK